MNDNNVRKNMRSGGISLLVLVLGVTIALAVSGLAVTGATIYTSANRTEAFEKALSIAQSGVEYYRWHLAHNPNDYKDGTNHSGPYIHSMNDPYGNTEGSFSLTIDPPATGSSILTITSQGWVSSYPDVKRTVKAKYGISSLAKFSFLNNANMWFGKQTDIKGKVFSNGGIRMDADHDSTVESAKSTYLCGEETGCTVTPTPMPGVWGDGGPKELWRFPVTPVDFQSISLDFNALKAAAIATGVHLATSNGAGYHITFAADGTYTIKKVTGVDTRKGWSVENGCETLNQIITNETSVGTYQVSQKNVIFAEDTLWIEGVVKGKITVVAAKFPLDTSLVNIWIKNNITYVTRDGTDNLGIIAQNDIYFPLEIPQIFEIDAALLAYKGKILRHNYKTQSCKHYNDAVRQQLIIYGSIISNMKSYWTYGQGETGGPTSGFTHPDLIYDPYLYYSPPPYFPTTGQYEFISWEEY